MDYGCTPDALEVGHDYRQLQRQLDTLTTKDQPFLAELVCRQQLQREDEE